MEERHSTAVQLDRQRVLTQLAAVFGVGTVAVWRQGVGLLAALHAGAAVRVQGDGVGVYELQRLAHAVREHLHVEFGAELLFDLADGL